MKKIINTYGHFILDAIVVIILMTFFFAGIMDNEGNRGIMAILGAHMQTSSIDYNSYNDFDVFEQEAAKPIPVLNYTTATQMHVGNNNIVDYLKATSCTGANLNIKILDITDSLGNSVFSGYDPANQTITFSAAGIYTIRMVTVDEVNKKALVDVRVPVSEV